MNLLLTIAFNTSHVDLFVTYWLFFLSLLFFLIYFLIEV